MSGRLLSVLGPTASGKSSVAMQIARRLHGEIVSCDSMQVYRGLDIGTAKPSPAEQAEIPHHLVDIRDLHEPWDARAFRTAADAAIRDILSRGRQPILCGGTGLYARLLLYGLRMQPGDREIAATVRAEYRERGREPLLAELAAIDPASAEAVGGNDRRLLRALEIIRITGAPIAHATPDPPAYAAPEFVLLPPAPVSHDRIARRTRAMLEAGWIEETERLVAQGLLGTPTAGQALGYPQIAAWLEAGADDRDALADELVLLTRRYAKRQRTWFRHQHPNARQVPVARDARAADLADRIAALFTEGGAS